MRIAAPASVQNPGDRAQSDRDGVVGGLADPDGARSNDFGDQDAADVAERDQQDAEVEQRAAQAQQAALVELGGAGGPAELVVAVPPVVAHHEDGDRDVGDDDPEDDVDRAGGAGAAACQRRAGKAGRSSRAILRLWHVLRRCERRQADLLLRWSLRGQPGHRLAARRRAAAAAWPRPNPARSPTGEAMSCRARRSSSSPARCSSSSARPACGVAVAANSSTTREVVGQFVVGQPQPGRGSRSA